LFKNFVQRSDFAAGGIFHNCLPGTAAGLCFVDEIKNFCRVLFVGLDLLLIVVN